jgi:hypothetical protein
MVNGRVSKGNIDQIMSSLAGPGEGLGFYCRLEAKQLKDTQ